MTDQEQQNRSDALNEACRHRLAKETSKDIVENAQRYYKFLQGDK